MTDRQTPEWRYAVDHSNRHETRHDAVGTAAIINGRRSRIASKKGTLATVWAYQACVCAQAQTTLDSQAICQRCGGAIEE